VLAEQQPFRESLVEAEVTRERRRSGVWNARRFTDELDGSILAVASVQRDERGVRRFEGARQVGVEVDLADVVAEVTDRRRDVMPRP
jgi:hypothetical protein